jgi:hypothetical protein
MLFALVFIGLVPATKAFAATTSGDFSSYGGGYSGITWSYEDTTETLTINGSGAMPNFTYNYNLTQIIGYKSVKHLIISEGITSIGSFAMYKNTGLEDVYIASTVKTIGSYAFDECFTYGSLGGNYWESGLKTITGMQGVETIGDYAFYSSSRLSEIPTLPNLKTVGENAFYYTKLTAINAPALTTVGNYAFRGITSLISVNAPSLNSIGTSAFEGDTSLNSLSISSNPTIALGAFVNTPVHSSYHGKSKVGIGQSNVNDVIAEYDDYTQIIRVYGSGAMRDFTYSSSLLGSLTTTGTIVKLVIEDGVTNVGNYFLYKVVGVPEVDIASSVKSIGSFAFAEMVATIPKGLLKVTGIQGIESIGDYAFNNSYNMTAIASLPTTLTTIGQYAFANTSSLNGLVNKAKTPQTIGSSAFAGMGSSLSQGERVVSANSTNTTFLTAMQNTSLNHQIIYLDAIPDPADYTLEQWVANGNNADDWFTDGRSISTYISQGGTSDSWGNLYGWYPNSFLSFGSSSSGWLSFGGTSGLWTSTGGTASSWMNAGGSGASWVSGGGTQESFIAAGGTIADFSITTPDKVSNTAAQIILTADQTLFGFSFPTDIPIHQLSDFTVVTPSDLQITNLSAAGQILITSVNVVGLDNWVTEDFTTDFKQMKVNSKKFGISLNGNRADKSTNDIPVQGDLATPIKPGESRNLVIDFKMSGQSQQLTNSPAQILITLDWYK